MPVTDLSWNQVGNEVNLDRSPFRMVEFAQDGNTYNRLFLDISPFVGEQVIDASQIGVVKFAAKFHDYCRKAQDTVNVNQVPGEKLAAFSAPIVGTPNAGTIPVSRNLASRVDIGSATKIVGPNG